MASKENMPEDKDEPGKDSMEYLGNSQYQSTASDKYSSKESEQMIADLKA